MNFSMRRTQAELIDHSAAIWLIRLDCGSPSTDDRENYDQWMASSARHRAAYRRLEKAWRQADNLQRLRPLDGSINPALLTDYSLLRQFGIGGKPDRSSW